MFFDLILLIAMAYLNAVRAKRKGKTAWVWGLLTVVSFFVCTVLGEMIVLGLFYKGPLTADALQSFFINNILSLLFCFVCGIGGFLLVRYILDRKPDKPIDSN